MADVKDYYLGVKETSGLKFRFHSNEAREKLKTNYDYWLKFKKNYGLMRRNEQKKLETWSKDQGAWVLIDEDQFWYDNEEGKRRSYLTNVFGYECSFETPQSLTLWNGQATVSKFYMELGYGQNEVMKQMTSMNGLNRFYQWTKTAGRWMLFDGGEAKELVTEQQTPLAQPKPEVVEESVVNSPTEMLTGEESTWITSMKSLKMEPIQFEEWLKTNSNLEPNRITFLVDKYKE